MQGPYEDRLMRVLDYIHDNPTEDLSLDALSDIAAMSRFHWHRVFHAMTGETCAAAARRIRLHRAACWLVQKDGPVAEVAKACGYQSPQSFTRAFSQMYRMSPAAFRNRGELRSPLPKPEKGEYPMFPVEVTDQPPRRLAAIPHTGPYLEIGKTFEKASTLFTTRELWPQAQGMVGVYYDDPNAIAAEDLSSHAGIAVSSEMDMPADFDEITIRGGKYAVMHYKGPYAGLKAAYDHLYGNWLPTSGEEPDNAPPIEIYLNSPREVEPDALLTDVCVPLK
ncbi:AraC family transcriptional regulator [Litoreibacter roseus]|uniref:AraC family transcriptional regulator n=1 Tax=Litoreibacter roseus TaxID=2601869 RepID=A0A6N6JJR8_9RHOB|nr:AraC family transcriptional regulator [Litoreibacter roseus]GFE66384.1 AraC family transcriptional regulator [Litoreibacter roseus]